MTPLTADKVRGAFVNCSKGETKRIVLPNLAQTPWDDLDFLGWQDPAGSQRAYLVLERPAGLVGLVLRQSPISAGTVRRTTMCQICVTPHSGQDVTMSVARKTGARGKKGDSTGIYMCRDLSCSLYIRAKKVARVPSLRETLSLEASVARCRRNLDRFVNRVLAG